MSIGENPSAGDDTKCAPDGTKKAVPGVNITPLVGEGQMCNNTFLDSSKGANFVSAALRISLVFLESRTGH